MRTLKIGRLEVGIELWCRPTDTANWQLGSESEADAFGSRLYWIGPVHMAVCWLPQRTVTAPK